MANHSARHAFIRSVVLLIFLRLAAPLPQGDFNYRPRGDRSEGLVQPKASGNDLELVSAVANYVEPETSLPDALTIQFYLPDTIDAYITVRGVRVAQDYWMNRVRPRHPWTKGFDNRFSWSTDDVLRPLKIVESMYDLGVVVRLGKDEGVTDFVEERVAPAFFYHSQLLASVTGYRFTFKPITYEQLDWSVFREQDGHTLGIAISSGTLPRVEPGVPFVIEWDSNSAKEGWYKLVVKGRKQYSGGPVDKVVHFYHAKTSINKDGR